MYTGYITKEEIGRQKTFGLKKAGECFCYRKDALKDIHSTWYK